MKKRRTLLLLLPVAGGRGRGAPPPQPGCVGRTADGANTDSNCADFVAQNATPGAPNQR